MKDLATKNTKDTKKVWPKVRLGDVCTVLRGVRVTRKQLDDDGKYKVYQNSLKPLGKYCSFNCHANNPFMIMALAAGEVGFSEEPFWAADDCTYFKDLKRLSSKFLYFLLLMNKQELRRNVRQTTIPRLSNKFLEDLVIPLPDLSVQREIVARLEKELGEADKLAAKFKRVAELADDAFKAELDETFKALEDNSRRDAEARRVRLGDVCEFVRNGANIKQRKGAAGIPITRIETLSGGVFNSQKVGYADIMNKEPFEKHIVGIGDLLISHINSAQFVGRTVMYRGEINGPIIHGMNLLRARLLDSGKILPAYVELWFKTISARIYISGVTKKSVNQASVNTTDFKRMPIIRPPISTQRAIIAKLDAAKERCEKLKAAAMRGLAAAENLRKAILAEAFEQ